MVELSSDTLGPEFNVTVEVRNYGPSHSLSSTLIIYWPLMDPLQPTQFFLYPLRINSVSEETLRYIHAIIVCVCVCVCVLM